MFYLIKLSQLLQYSFNFIHEKCFITKMMMISQHLYILIYFDVFNRCVNIHIEIIFQKRSRSVLSKIKINNNQMKCIFNKYFRTHLRWSNDIHEHYSDMWLILGLCLVFQIELHRHIDPAKIDVYCNTKYNQIIQNRRMCAWNLRYQKFASIYLTTFNTTPKKTN